MCKTMITFPKSFLRSVFISKGFVLELKIINFDGGYLFNLFL